MQIAIANLKGGTAKTTTAVYLALGLARTGRTLLVDSDPQGSSLNWSEEAGDFPITVIAWPTRDLARRVEQVAADYEHIVIDTPPSHEVIVRQALLASRLLVIPLAPSLVEVGRLGPTFDPAAEVEPLHPLIPRVLLTRVRLGTRSAREARALLTAKEVPTFSAEIPLRETYATAYGLTPTDLAEYAGVLAELMQMQPSARSLAEAAR
jgi:chromosome partitioning protein